MYFILSKVFLFLLYPLNWIIILLFIAAFTGRKRLRKRAAISAAIVTYIFSCPAIFQPIANAWDVWTPALKPTEQYSCAIILGGFASSDSDNQGYFNGASDRFLQGVRLFHTGHAQNILISGGNGELFPGSFSEGKWTHGQLLQFKVPDKNILTEGKSRNTMENARFSKVLLEQSGLKPPYLLVTSAFHMRRAQKIYQNQGLQVVPYSCHYQTFKYTFTFGSLLPDLNCLSAWGQYLKEFVGYLVNSKMH